MTSRRGPRSTRRLALVVWLALSAAVAVPAAVAAATVEDLVALAEGTYGMGCAGSATEVNCSARTMPWQANIKPGSGPIDSLDTAARPPQNTPPLDATSRAWMADMHDSACGAPKAIAAFVGQVGDLTKVGTLGPIDIGTCSVYGGLYDIGSLAPVFVYHVVSLQLPPPTAGPTSTAGPTPTPTPVATATPKPTATPAPSASGAASPSAEPSATPGASASPSPVAPSTTPAAASPSPVVAGEATAEPSSGPTPSEAPGGGATPEPSLPTFEGAVLGITDVNTDDGAVGGSLLLALLLLLIVGFIGELFNNTVENNYDEIAGWFRKGPFGWFRRQTDRVRIDPPGRPGVLLFIALTALVSSFVDPGFGLNVRSVAIFLGFLIGLIVVLASFKLPPILARRRRTGELAQLRPLPWALVIAALFVLVSRVAHLQPGYLYGIVLGAIFVTGATDRDEGRETVLGILWTLAAAVLAWVALTWLRGQGLPPDGFGVILLSTAFAATMVAGLEAAAFALMPLRFLPGYALYRWNRVIWALLWGISLFAFFHILIGPTSGYVSELSPTAFMAALGVFAVFGALSIATWLYFRFRKPPLPESAEAG